MSMLRLSPSPTSSPTRPSFLDSDDNDESDQASQRSISLSSPRTSVYSLARQESVDTNTTFEDARQTMHFHDHEASKVADALQHVTEEAKEEEALTEATDKNVNETQATQQTSRTEPGTGGNSEMASISLNDANDAAIRSASSDGSVNGGGGHAKSTDEQQAKPRDSQVSMASVTSSIKYPPTPLKLESDASSMVSHATSSSRKARPESALIEPPIGPIVPGIALVDFNHLVGPRIEFSDGRVFEDEQLAYILPFLALPDGAHLSSEDYSYFHLVPPSPHPTTIFGISCNRQMKADDLLVKGSDVTRSTVQKAVVVLATKPLFGPIRDRLGVITRALFEQRDFRETGILVDFRNSLEITLRQQLTESALYMGTNLRELVHKFRSRTLLLLKALMLQKRIMFYGHPVERLCTYQYSLISLIPELLQHLDDSGSPPLASRAPMLSRATSLKTSDRRSLMAYLGLPLDLFGKDAFFQPYLPLQQVDLTKETRSYLCGCTNSIMTQQKEIDLLVNIETNTFEYRDPQLERIVALTAADRKWMDDIVRDVNEGWDETSSDHNSNIRFRGSDDYIRIKFEEYVTAALSSVKYAEFLRKGSQQEVVISDADGSDANAILDFNPLWIAEFKKTNAFEVWNRVTDPMLFDIVEARHPCSGKPSVVEDISLRLQEGLQDLNLQEQLAPTREAISRTLANGSSGFFKAVEGVRGRWAQRSQSASTSAELTGKESVVDAIDNVNGTPVPATASRAPRMARLSTASTATTSSSGLRPLSIVGSPPPQTAPATSIAAANAKAAVGTWGSSIGSFISQKTARFSAPRSNSGTSSLSEGSDPSSPANDKHSSTDGLPTVKEAITELTPASPPGSVASNSAGLATPTPMSSMFSSWSFGRASPSKSPSPAPPAPSSSGSASPASNKLFGAMGSSTLNTRRESTTSSASVSPIGGGDGMDEFPPEFRPRNLDEELPTPVSMSSEEGSTQKKDKAGETGEAVNNVEEPESPTQSISTKSMQSLSSSASNMQTGMAL